MLKVNNYLLESNKIKNDIDILNITDVHSNIKSLKKIKNYLENNKVDYIVMVGDIIDRHNLKNEDKFIDELINLSKNTKIIIALGNHEIYAYKSKKHISNIKETNYYKKLINNENIYLIIENFKELNINNELSISILNMSNEYYENKEDLKLFNNQLLNIKENINTNKFNILLSHTPNPLINKNKIIDNDLINKFDLILTGHNHAGLIPDFIQDRLNNHIGLFGPFNNFISKNAYGYYQNDNKTLLISNGVTKLSNSTGVHLIRNFISDIYGIDIDLIKIRNNKENTFTLKQRKKYR